MSEPREPAGNGALGILSFDALTIDLDARVVHRGVRKVRITPLEFDLLVHLVRHAGLPLTRGHIIRGVWPDPDDIDERTVDVHIGKLRAALNRGRDFDYLTTVRGVGYCFAMTPPGRMPRRPRGRSDSAAR